MYVEPEVFQFGSTVLNLNPFDNMSVFAKDNESAIEHKYFDSKANETSKVAERVETYKSIYATLKKEFKVFMH